MGGRGKWSLRSLPMASTHIPRAIGKLRLPLPPIIESEHKTAYIHDTRGSDLPPSKLWKSANRRPWATHIICGMSQSTEHDWVERAKQGEPTAIAELYRRYWRAARAAAYGVIGNLSLAEDAASEAFSAAMSGLANLRYKLATTEKNFQIVAWLPHKSLPRRILWQKPRGRS